jgi:hypothetical protein
MRLTLECEDTDADCVNANGIIEIIAFAFFCLAIFKQNWLSAIFLFFIFIVAVTVLK